MGFYRPSAPPLLPADPRQPLPQPSSEEAETSTYPSSDKYHQRHHHHLHSQHEYQQGCSPAPPAQQPYVYPPPLQQPYPYPPPLHPPPDPAPPAFGFPVALPREHPRWSTHLCQCGADPTVCVLGCFCPCLLMGWIAERLDDGMTSCLTACLVWYLLQQFTACGWIYSCGYRSKLRARYGLPQRPILDCIVHFCCWPCAFCQEYRELQIRRLREEATWERYAAMAPPPTQTMYRLG